jgi:hypothetical protein
MDSFAIFQDFFSLVALQGVRIPRTSYSLSVFFRLAGRKKTDKECTMLPQAKRAICIYSKKNQIASLQSDE